MIEYIYICIYTYLYIYIYTYILIYIHIWRRALEALLLLGSCGRVISYYSCYFTL